MFRDQTKDPIIKNEGFDTKMAFIESFSNTDIWDIRVKEACKKSGITVPEDITPIDQGQNPVSLYKSINWYFLKRHSNASVAVLGFQVLSFNCKVLFSHI